MTHDDWLASDDPRAMLNALPAERSDPSRRLRLWVQACRDVANPGGTHWAEIGTPVGLRDSVEFWGDPSPGGWRHECPMPLRAALLREVVGDPFAPVRLPPKRCPDCGCLSQLYDCPNCRRHGAHPWLTPTVVSLAHAAYDLRLPDGTLDAVRLAVLSDALEEAGCDCEPLLRHLRGWRRCVACLREVGRNAPRCVCAATGGWLPSTCGPYQIGPHVRGCWALDLLLAKD